MHTWAIVPVKPLGAAKSRLSKVLQPAERADLARHFLEHTLAALSACRGVDETLVISADPLAWKLAAQYGAQCYCEADTPGLNTSLRRAASRAVSRGANAILIVPTDLPLLNETHLQQVIESVNQAPAVTLAPDRHRKGTNIMLQSPPNVIPFSYGIGSFQTHLKNARTAGAAISVLEIPELALDIDSPADLKKADLVWLRNTLPQPYRNVKTLR
jgi:2-phospho-L-lactate/phosphoenolpyruvate guanylyltransferase